MECPVCFETKNQLDLCLTNCNHLFCIDCLDKWFYTKKITCPICRVNIKYYKHNDIIHKLITIAENRPRDIENNIRNTHGNRVNTITIPLVRYNLMVGVSLISFICTFSSIVFYINTI